MKKSERPVTGAVSADDLSRQDPMDGERTDRFRVEMRRESQDSATRR